MCILQVLLARLDRTREANSGIGAGSVQVLSGKRKTRQRNQRRAVSSVRPVDLPDFGNRRGTHAPPPHRLPLAARSHPPEKDRLLRKLPDPVVSRSLSFRATGDMALNFRSVPGEDVLHVRVVETTTSAGSLLHPARITQNAVTMATTSRRQPGPFAMQRNGEPSQRPPLDSPVCRLLPLASTVFPIIVAVVEHIAATSKLTGSL